MTGRTRLLLLALLALGTWPGSLVSAQIVWNTPLTTSGTYNYQWTLTKTVNGGAAGTTAQLRVQKGIQTQVPYQLQYTRSIDQTSVNMMVTGTFVVTVPDGATFVSGSVSLSNPNGAPSTVTPACTVNSPTQVTCVMTNAPYAGFLTAGTATASVTLTNGTIPPADGPFSFESITGNFATALITDTADLSQVDALYTGFTGYSRTNIWRATDPSTAIPTSGLTVQDSDTKSYSYTVGSFVVCTGTNGVTITNTATLTPQGTSGNGTPKTSTASLTMVIWGCELPPDVNFQNLQTWGAQTFTWAMAKRAAKNVFTVDQTAGVVPIDYTLTATATPSTASYAVSGAVFINNVQPGILNIARLYVQLSSGQQAIPTCTLTSPYIAADGLVWGGANAGGSITTMPFLGSGTVPMTGAGVASTIAGGTFNQFILPEFSSASCTFNISLGATSPGSTVQIIPMIFWGFGGMYTLNKPSQMELSFNPVTNFFPVGGCVSITDVAQGGSLQLANGGPNNQQVCISGNSQPFAQPAPINYQVTATINPTTTADCQAGGQKTYSITNTATASPVGAPGSPVTATADPPVAITVTCAKPSPVIPVNPQEAPAVSNLNVVVGDFQTFTAGEHAWTVEKKADDSTLSLRIGELPKTITYTLKVTKLPANDNKFFVFGKITVTNPGTKPVDVSTVSVTAGTAAVPAKCPADSKQVLPGTPLICTFNVTWNNGANAGSLGARVDTPEASFYGSPASFDFTNPRRGGTRGVTADVYDDVTAKTPAAATGVPTKWWTSDGTSPPAKADGIPLTTVDSREYTYTIQVGPFADKGSCGTYTLSNLATVVPSDTAAAAVTATADVSISVTGCKDNEFQEVKGDLAATVSGVKVARLDGNTWSVNGGVAPPGLALSYAKPGQAVFNVTFTKVPTTQYEVSGTVTVTNANTAKAVDVQGVTVSVEGKNGTATTVDASCGARSGTFSLAVGSSIPCTFTAVVDSSAGGDIIAIATDGSGKQTESKPESYAVNNATSKPAPNAPSCATASTGMVVGAPTWLPKGVVANKQTTKRICATETISVPVTLGPLKDVSCGTVTAMHIASLQPMAVTANPISGVTPIAINVTGCPKTAAVQPIVTATTPKAEVQEVYSWTATLTTDTKQALSFKQKSPVKVNFVATTQRSPVKRSLNVSGSVTLEARGAGPVSIESATVAVYDGQDKYTVAPLTCGAAGAKAGGPVTLKGKGQQVTCTYSVGGLSVGNGAVLPIVTVAKASGPAPADPKPYSTKGATKNIVGDCADLGSSMQLLSGGKRAAWQPAFVGQAMSSGADCDGGDTQRFAMWFGANAQGAPNSPACGDYVFRGTLNVVPTNGGALEKEVKFPVKVTGC